MGAGDGGGGSQPIVLLFWSTDGHNVCFGVLTAAVRCVHNGFESSCVLNRKYFWTASQAVCLRIGLDKGKGREIYPICCI